MVRGSSKMNNFGLKSHIDFKKWSLVIVKRPLNLHYIHSTPQNTLKVKSLTSKAHFLKNRLKTKLFTIYHNTFYSRSQIFTFDSSKVPLPLFTTTTKSTQTHKSGSTQINFTHFRPFAHFDKTLPFKKYHHNPAFCYKFRADQNQGRSPSFIFKSHPLLV